MGFRISVYVLADQSIYRAVLRRRLDSEQFALVGHTGSMDEALCEVENQQPQVLLLDATLLGSALAEKVRLLRRVSPSTRVIVLAHEADAAQIEATLEAGADGYVTKDGHFTELGRAIEAAHRGVPYVSAHVCRHLHVAHLGASLG